MATTKKKTVKKAPKKIAETTTFMGLLKKGWEFDKIIFKLHSMSVYNSVL